MNTQLKKVLFYFKMLMSLVYIALGLGFIFKKDGIGNFIPEQYVPILGVLLIVYGAFRGYRAYFAERNV